MRTAFAGAIALARRYYHHICNGGTLAVHNVGMMVATMEMMEEKIIDLETKIIELETQALAIEEQLSGNNDIR